MKVIPVKVPNARSLWSVDGMVLAIELFSVIGVFAATVLLIFLLYYNPASGALWLALPLCLALLVGSGLKVRLDWQHLGVSGKDGESETRPRGNPA